MRLDFAVWHPVKVIQNFPVGSGKTGVYFLLSIISTTLPSIVKSVQCTLLQKISIISIRYFSFLSHLRTYSFTHNQLQFPKFPVEIENYLTVNVKDVPLPLKSRVFCICHTSKARDYYWKFKTSSYCSPLCTFFSSIISCCFPIYLPVEEKWCRFFLMREKEHK